jgi:hypothetical protein
MVPYLATDLMQLQQIASRYVHVLCWHCCCCGLAKQGMGVLHCRSHGISEMPTCSGLLLGRLVRADKTQAQLPWPQQKHTHMSDVSGKPWNSSTVPLVAVSAPESFTHSFIPFTVM